VASLCFVFFTIGKSGSDFWILFGFSALIGALAIWRHHSNIGLGRAQ
jgi:hypothetical protein